MPDFVAEVAKIEALPVDPAIMRKQFQEATAHIDSIRMAKDAGYKNGKPVFAAVGPGCN
jgi:hypothetical protein